MKDEELNHILKCKEVTLIHAIKLSQVLGFTILTNINVCFTKIISVNVSDLNVFTCKMSRM